MCTSPSSNISISASGEERSTCSPARRFLPSITTSSIRQKMKSRIKRRTGFVAASPSSPASGSGPTLDGVANAFLRSASSDSTTSSSSSSSSSCDSSSQSFTSKKSRWFKPILPRRRRSSTSTSSSSSSSSSSLSINVTLQSEPETYTTEKDVHQAKGSIEEKNGEEKDEDDWYYAEKYWGSVVEPVAGGGMARVIRMVGKGMRSGCGAMRRGIGGE